MELRKNIYTRWEMERDIYSQLEIISIKINNILLVFSRICDFALSNDPHERHRNVHRVHLSLLRNFAVCNNACTSSGGFHGR